MSVKRHKRTLIGGEKMAKRIKGITIELDGETKGLDKALQDVNKRSRDLTSELKEVDKALKFNPKNVELIAQKQELLSKQVETTKEKLDKLKQAEKQVQDQFKKGEIKEEQYRAFQRELIETESKLKHFEKKLKETQKTTETFGEKIEKAGKKVKGMGEKMKDVGGKMTAAFTVPIMAGLALVTEGTEELRVTLAKLETNADGVGVSFDSMIDSLVKLNGVTDDVDANVEALSNLLATGFDESGIQKTLDALAGAVIKFPDTLMIEGLADGLQETLATGAAIGPFAELLERLGMDLEVFNEGLEKAIKNGDEQNYILDTLAKHGLANIYESYKKNNEELVKSREAQLQFQLAMAELGEQLVPIITMATEAVTGLVEMFNELDPTAQKVILVILGILAVMGPLITMAGMLAISMTAISWPVMAVIAAITALIAIGVALYKNWDEITLRAKVAWKALKIGFQKVVDFFKDGVDKISGFFKKMKIKLPKIKLPHFKLEGKFSLLPPSVPKLKVDWYAQGGLFPANSPQIIGVGDNKNVPEAVLPLSDQVLGTIGKSIAEHIKGGGNGLTLNVENFNNYSSKDIRTIAQELAFYMKQQGAFQ